MDTLAPSLPILGERTTLASGRFIGLVSQPVTMPNGITFQYEIVVRRRVSEIVAVAPLTTTGDLLLLEQFRIPLARPVIEFPAGLCDQT